MTKDDIIRMAKKIGLPFYKDGYSLIDIDVLTSFANLVATHERDACAKLCEINQMNSYACAQLIRARSQS